VLRLAQGSGYPVPADQGTREGVAWILLLMSLCGLVAAEEVKFSAAPTAVHNDVNVSDRSARGGLSQGRPRSPRSLAEPPAAGYTPAMR
jgi:hypothetical protein